jgi:O-acetyl-ADP-ribose deacetylase (regulator of RNase III)
MISLIENGDILQSEAQTLTNAVNCVGVMGKGIALQFKRRFPEMYQDYVQCCEAGLVRLGQPYLYRNSEPPHILNFPTKDHWRSASTLETIEQGLDYLVANCQLWGIESLAVPALGCGAGQLAWSDVKPILVKHLGKLAIPVYLYTPQ